MLEICVVGGGASGIAAAIAAGNMGSHVTIIEKNEAIGKKILATGNGKCNFTNLNMGSQYYYCSDSERLALWLDKFGATDSINLFRRIGLTVVNKNGYVYPYSGQASSVVEVLEYELNSLKVDYIFSSSVTSIRPVEDKFEVEFRNNINGSVDLIAFDRVIIATGGLAAPTTGSTGDGYELCNKLGHSTTELTPALCALKCKEKCIKNLSGIRCQAKISLFEADNKLCEQEGELQLTDYGISGIPVFQISRIAAEYIKNKQINAVIDFFPDFGDKEWEELIMLRTLLGSERTVKEYFAGLMNNKLLITLLGIAGINPEDNISLLLEKYSKKIDTFLQLCRGLKLTIVGTNDYSKAQTTAGGICLNEINDDFSSNICKGLYIVGELLDVDGICGGYNLQFAWTSGYIAGISAASGK